MFLEKNYLKIVRELGFAAVNSYRETTADNRPWNGGVEHAPNNRVKDVIEGGICRGNGQRATTSYALRPDSQHAKQGGTSSEGYLKFEWCGTLHFSRRARETS